VCVPPGKRLFSLCVNHIPQTPPARSPPGRAGATQEDSAQERPGVAPMNYLLDRSLSCQIPTHTRPPNEPYCHPYRHTPPRYAGVEGFGHKQPQTMQKSGCPIRKGKRHLSLGNYRCIGLRFRREKWQVSFRLQTNAQTCRRAGRRNRNLQSKVFADSVHRSPCVQRNRARPVWKPIFAGRPCHDRDHVPMIDSKTEPYKNFDGCHGD
jgi:hypothetical protein